MGCVHGAGPWVHSSSCICGCLRQPLVICVFTHFGRPVGYVNYACSWFSACRWRFRWLGMLCVQYKSNVQLKTRHGFNQLGICFIIVFMVTKALPCIVGFACAGGQQISGARHNCSQVGLGNMEHDLPWCCSFATFSQECEPRLAWRLHQPVHKGGSGHSHYPLRVVYTSGEAHKRQQLDMITLICAATIQARLHVHLIPL